MVQANYPAPTKRTAYYFEMTVKNAGVKGQCSIGFTTEGFKMRRQPGYVFVCLCLAKQTFYIQILIVYTPCPDEAAKHLMYYLQKL